MALIAFGVGSPQTAASPIDELGECVNRVLSSAAEPGAPQQPFCDPTETRYWVSAFADESDLVQGYLSATSDCTGLTTAWYTVELGVAAGALFANGVIKADRAAGACSYTAGGECAGTWLTAVTLTAGQYAGGVYFLVGEDTIGSGFFDIWMEVGNDLVLMGECRVGAPDWSVFWAEGWDASAPVYGNHDARVDSFYIGGTNPALVTEAEFKCFGEAEDSSLHGWDDIVSGDFTQGSRTAFDNDRS